MKTTLTTKGLVVIPRDIRVKWGLKQGHELVVLCSLAGEILLRPVWHPGRCWLKSLRAMRGLKLKRMDEPIRNLDL